MRSAQTKKKFRDPPACPTKAFLAIDPGLSGTGWAYFNTEEDKPKAIGVIPSRDRGDSWWDRANQMAEYVYEETRQFAPRMVVCEMPQQMTSAAGLAAQGDANIYKLAFLVGTLAHASRGWWHCRFIPVFPPMWKGQLPKSVVEKRIQRAVGPKRCARLGIRTHAWDAVGIGLWARGNKEFYR